MIKFIIRDMGTKVFQPEKCKSFVNYPVRICFSDVDSDFESFTSRGLARIRNKLPQIFHATKENQAKLEAFHGIEFEKPPVKLTSKEIIKAMLERGDKCVPSWLSDYKENPTTDDQWDYAYYVEDGEKIIDVDGHAWRYATPFDPRTGESITELPT